MRNGWWIKIEKFFWALLLLITFIFLLALRYLEVIFPGLREWTTLLEWKGTLFFFLVPLWIWGIGTLFIKRNEFTAKVFAFIAGSDNRLSLSRLQAFAWTLVIFGSWVAAMGIHTKIIPVTQAKANEYSEQAKIAKSQSDALKINWDKANADYNDSVTLKDNADKVLRDADAGVEVQNAADPNSEAAKTAQNAARTAKMEADKQAIVLKNADSKRKDVEKLYQDALKKSVEIENTVSGLNWVTIPAALLALAGIAIGSGIFSSIISAVNSEDKTACVTGVILITAEQFKLEHPDLPQPSSNNLLKIKGKDLNKSGKVRLGKGRIFSAHAPTPFWKDDGSEIVADVPANTDYDTIVVDTPNGKLTHKLNVSPLNYGLDKANLTERLDEAKKLTDLETVRTTKETELAKAKEELSNLAAGAGEVIKKNAELTVSTAETGIKNAENLLATAKTELEKKPEKELLGEFKYYYEFSDLFRDDKNPSNMDLMKFQMFGWTIVAIVVYSFLFLNDLRENIESLPLVPQSIVILTGLSQAGYLAGKGVSNIPANEKTNS